MKTFLPYKGFSGVTNEFGWNVFQWSKLNYFSKNNEKRNSSYFRSVFSSIIKWIRSDDISQLVKKIIGISHIENTLKFLLPYRFVDFSPLESLSNKIGITVHLSMHFCKQPSLLIIFIEPQKFHYSSSSIPSNYILFFFIVVVYLRMFSWNWSVDNITSS